MPKHYTIPIFIPELACPFQCVFCNQQKITGQQLIPDDETIINTIDEHLSTFKEAERIVEIGFFGGSFTGIPLDQQRHYLELVKPFVDDKKVSGIRLSTRPDYIDKEILDLLMEYGVRSIELGAQSFSDEVLNASMRGHTARQTEEASLAILEYGFELGLQMMIGLPGDTFLRSEETAKRIIKLGASTTRIYPAIVIKDTALHRWFNDGKYKPLSIEEAVDWTSAILPLFEEAGVKVLRVGLHPSEGLLSGEELIAGPFHPSFKELVLTNIWKEKLKPLMVLGTGNSIEIHVPEREINYAIGYRSGNRKMLEQEYQSVKFTIEVKLSGREFKYRTH